MAQSNEVGKSSGSAGCAVRDLPTRCWPGVEREPERGASRHGAAHRLLRPAELTHLRGGEPAIGDGGVLDVPGPVTLQGDGVAGRGHDRKHAFVEVGQGFLGAEPSVVDVDLHQTGMHLERPDHIDGRLDDRVGRAVRQRGGQVLDLGGEIAELLGEPERRLVVRLADRHRDHRVDALRTELDRSVSGMFWRHPPSTWRSAPSRRDGKIPGTLAEAMAPSITSNPVASDNGGGRRRRRAFRRHRRSGSLVP